MDLKCTLCETEVSGKDIDTTGLSLFNCFGSCLTITILISLTLNVNYSFFLTLVLDLMESYCHCYYYYYYVLFFHRKTLNLFLVDRRIHVTGS